MNCIILDSSFFFLFVLLLLLYFFAIFTQFQICSTFHIFIMLEVIFVQCWLLFLYLLFYPRIKVGFVIYSYFILLLRKVILYTQGQCYNSSKVLFIVNQEKDHTYKSALNNLSPKHGFRTNRFIFLNIQIFTYMYLSIDELHTSKFISCISTFMNKVPEVGPMNF